MDTRKDGDKPPAEPNADQATEEFSPDLPGYEAIKRGRRLVLKFVGDEAPVLARIQFKLRREVDERILVKDHPLKGEGFEWDKVSPVLSLLFIQYLIWDKNGRTDTFYFSGKHRWSQAASLGDAFYKDNPFQELFFDPTAPLPEQKLMLRIFHGDNLHGKSVKKIDRRISVDENFLPPECVQIFWNARGTSPLTKHSDLQLLANRIRIAWKLPVEAPPKPTGEGREEIIAEPPGEILTPPFREKKPESATEVFDPPPVAPPPKPEPQPTPPTPPAPEPPPGKPDQENQPAPEPEYPAPPPIDPRLFTVPQTGGYWPDEAPLVELPDEEDNLHAWTLKNAFEGVLILGRTGSGKTSGSGFTIAEAFLRGGFGGLVLTVKKNEAEHWRRLCAYCGREKDLVVVRRGGDWKLNILAYEAQHPGQGAGLSDNLTAFCRTLLKISARSQGPQHHEQIWEQAGDQLLNATFDLFLLAGGAITYDRLADFVASAPAEKLPKTEADWLEVPVFGSVLVKAANSLNSLEDKRLFAKAQQYWFKTYAGYPAKVRSSITLGIYAMFDAFRGRDVPALISSETNITPESIMSGKIVVLDLPVKELRHTGLMVQSAWKYLFQTALERQHNANSPHRRPVFLWEDEAQYFFSDHDHHFQDTARSSRVSRVILTQNLPGFYKEFGRDGADIANSVFGNLNTKVFHNNDDPTTNEWAAKHFGMEIQTRYTFNHAPVPPPKDFFDGIRQSMDPPNTTSIGGGEHWEYAVRPEWFNELRTGGKENDYIVEAWVAWMGLSAVNRRHFMLVPFQQNLNL